MTDWNSGLVKKLFSGFYSDVSKTEGAKAEETNYTTVPMTNNTDIGIDTPWAKMMGVDIKNTNNKALFTDDDLAAFVEQYAPNVTPDVAENATDSVNAITDDNLYAFENVVPEGVQDYYAGHHVDGTADRIYAMGITSDDVADFTNGDASLLEISEILFRDAQYQKESA